MSYNTPRLLEGLVRILEEESREYSIIEYPEKSRKSIDVIAKGKQRKFVIRVSREHTSKDETKELKNFSVVLGGVPVIVTDETEEDIAMGKGNVVGLSLEGLGRALRGEKIFIYRTRGGIFIKIRPDVLRRKRIEMSYSMGDLSKLLGVTRKTVYDYETGESDVSIEVAEKLIDIFGEEIIGDVCDEAQSKLSLEEPTTSEGLSSKIADSLAKNGFLSATLRLTAVDVVASKGSEKVLVTIEPKNSEEAEKKLREATKIASGLRTKLLVMARNSTSARRLQRDGFNILTQDDIDSIGDEII